MSARADAAGYPVPRTVEVPIVYKGTPLACTFFIDLVVAEHLVVEMKTVDKLQPIHEAQLPTHLRLSGIHPGLLLSFNVRLLKDGLKRMVLWPIRLYSLWLLPLCLCGSFPLKSLDWIHLATLTKSPCSLSQAAYTEAKTSWLCCCAPKPGIQAIDARIRGERPADKPLNGIFNCGLGLIHDSLLRQLDEELVARDLFLGRVIGETGRTLPDWFTFRGKHRLIIRGSKDVSHRQCPRCGHAVYFATGQRYLFPQPPADVRLFGSDSWGIVMRGEDFRSVSVDDTSWKRLHVEKLKVLSEPLDGLGEYIGSSG